MGTSVSIRQAWRTWMGITSRDVVGAAQMPCELRTKFRLRGTYRGLYLGGTY